MKAFVCAWEHKRVERICHDVKKKSKGCGDMVRGGERSGRVMSGGGSGSSITLEWRDVVNVDWMSVVSATEDVQCRTRRRAVSYQGGSGTETTKRSESG